MSTLILMINNVREEQILKTAFEQLSIKVILAKPTYKNYVLVLQYLPDIFLIELPHLCTEQLAYVKRIRAYKRTRLIPIVGFGDKIDSSVKSGIIINGFTMYVDRPLKFTFLVKEFESLLKRQGKVFKPPEVVSDKEKDIELIINSDALPMQKIEVMMRYVSSLLAFPFTIAKILLITKDEETGAQKLAQVITSDPSIATHLLKVSNTVFFSRAGNRITTIRDAIVRIGFNETRKIVMCMQVVKLFEKNNKNSGFDRIDFWYHSVAVGLICEKVAKLMGGVNVETAFLAGLLHDFGIILLDEYLAPVFNRALEDTARYEAHFIEVQKELFNVTHNDLISGLFPQWKIPQDITDSIVNQFKINEIGVEFDTSGKKLTLCVAIGNVLAKTLSIGRECDEFVYPVANELMQKACLPYGVDKGLIADVDQKISIYQTFLELEKRSFPYDISSISEPDKFSIGIYCMDKAIFIPAEIYLKRIGFSTLRIKDFNGSENLHCLIIWDVEGKMSFNESKLVAGETDTGYSQSSGVPVIYIGNTPGAPEGMPGNFTYITSSFDLRTLEVAVSKVIDNTEVRQENVGE